MMCERNFLLYITIWISITSFGICATDAKVINVPPSTRLHLSSAALKNFLTRVLQQNVSMRACPAPKFPLNDNDCNLRPCNKDDDCATKNHSCCFNGCMFTCVEKIAPPPVIDWDEEPQIPPMKKHETSVLRCSTVPKPAPSLPASCPKGYACKMDDDFSDNTFPSTTGICVPEGSEPLLDIEPEKETGIKEKTRKQTVYLPGGCVLSEIQYQDVEDFKTRPYVVDCFCVDGSVECQING